MQTARLRRKIYRGHVPPIHIHHILRLCIIILPPSQSLSLQIIDLTWNNGDAPESIAYFPIHAFILNGSKEVSRD